MDARATIKLTPEYFAEAYDEFLQIRGPKRFFGLGVLVMLLCVLLAVRDRRFALSVVALCLLVIHQLHDVAIGQRRRWMKGRLDARAGNPHQVVEMTFTDDGIRMEGPTARGETSWSAFGSVDVTRRGLFLRLDGMSIYVPRASLQPSSALEAIAERCRRARADV